MADQDAESPLAVPNESMTNALNNHEPVIRIRDVTKIYDMGAGVIQVRALDGVSIDIHDGEYVAIMGASGSGKSTLMNIIGCLDIPTTGTYHIDGQAVEAMSNDRLADIRSRKVGFVFQTHNLLPRLTALANVELPMMYGHWPNRRERAENALTLVGLSRPNSPPTDRTLRRTTTKSRHRPGPRQRAISPPSRRADRKPRHLKLRRNPEHHLRP